MKILIVHNKYGSFSGEEAVIDKLSSNFLAKGESVMFYTKSSEGRYSKLCWKVLAFFTGLYSFSSNVSLQKLINDFRPDVVNIHNLYPFISPSILKVCKKNGIPVIMTVHNFRLICPTGLFMRNNMPCEYCLDEGNEWGCIKYNCEKTFFKSFAYALRNMFARKRRMYIDNVDCFACITNFQRRKLIQAGYDAKKIVVIPNFVDVVSDPDFCLGSYIAYSGRLSQEKGVDLILEVAKRHPEIPFKFAGDLLNNDFLLKTHVPSNCEFVGYLSGDKLSNFYKNALFFVMGSKCYEGFSMAILEAAKYGKCMIAPNHGSFTEVIGSGDKGIGLLFEPLNVDDLERKICHLLNDKGYLLELNHRAFEKVKEEYSSKIVMKKWSVILDHLANNE